MEQHTWRQHQHYGATHMKTTSALWSNTHEDNISTLEQHTWRQHQHSGATHMKTTSALWSNTHEDNIVIQQEIWLQHRFCTCDSSLRERLNVRQQQNNNHNYIINTKLSNTVKLLNIFKHNHSSWNYTQIHIQCIILPEIINCRQL